MALLSQGFSNDDRGRLGLLYARFFVRYFFLYLESNWDFFLESCTISQFWHEVTVNCTVLCKSAIIMLPLVFPNWSSPLKWFPEEKRRKKKSTAHMKKKAKSTKPIHKNNSKVSFERRCKQQWSLDFSSYPKQFPQRQFHKRVSRHYKSWMFNHRTENLYRSLKNINLPVWVRTKQFWRSTKNTTFYHDLRLLFPCFLMLPMLSIATKYWER